mmetsp:Transcript_36538/g.50910  ORF Transcript_36538/g.50910 Transcript_36538/m.50910 type:complete len:247 (-) Transcript_36538:386-1126(-)
MSDSSTLEASAPAGADASLAQAASTSSPPTSLKATSAALCSKPIDSKEAKARSSTGTSCLCLLRWISSKAPMTSLFDCFKALRAAASSMPMDTICRTASGSTNTPELVRPYCLCARRSCLATLRCDEAARISSAARSAEPSQRRKAATACRRVAPRLRREAMAVSSTCKAWMKSAARWRSSRAAATEPRPAFATPRSSQRRTEGSTSGGNVAPCSAFTSAKVKKFLSTCRRIMRSATCSRASASGR